MIALKEPYFMEKEKWYYFDEDEFKYKLRPGAPEKVKKSYEDFYRRPGRYLKKK